MRVVAGKAGGRRLLEPADSSIRPTTDMVKESVFNIIQFDIEGRRVLDLFSGTGQLGIEALSRGAKSAVFVDESKASVALTKENLKRTGLEAAASVVQGDSVGFLKHSGKFDLIFLDPPYDMPLLEKSVRMIEEFDILTQGGIMVCESRAEAVLPELSAPYRYKKSYKYGKIKITVCVRDSEI